MTSLEQLFALGSINETVNIHGVEFKLTTLDSKRLADALNSSIAIDAQAQDLAYKKQILARALTYIDGQKCFENPNEPTQEEIDAILEKCLDKFHYSIINQLYEEYDKLDKKVVKEVEGDAIKKSSRNRGAK